MLDYFVRPYRHEANKSYVQLSSVVYLDELLAIGCFCGNAYVTLPWHDTYLLSIFGIESAAKFMLLTAIPQSFIPITYYNLDKV